MFAFRLQHPDGTAAEPPTITVAVRLEHFVQTDVQTAALARGSLSFEAAFLQWARLDSNQGPTDYESAALTS